MSGEIWERFRRSRVGGFLMELSVEPILFFFYMAYALQSSAMFPAVYRKICYWSLDLDTCIALSLNVHPNQTALEQKIQNATSQFMMFCQLSKFFQVFWAALFFSSLSDRIGRKIPIVIALAAAQIYSVTFAFLSTSLHCPVWTLLVYNVISGFIPANQIVVSCCFSYLADRFQKQEELIIRYSFANAFWSLAFVFGGYLGGVLMNFFSLRAVMIMGQGIYLIPFLGTLLLMGDKAQGDEELEYQGTPEGKRPSILAEAVQHFKSSLKALGRWRPRNGRTHLILLGIVMMIYAAEDSGVDGIVSLFVFNYPLRWTKVTLSWYQASMNLIQMIGNLGGAFVLKTLKFADTTIGGISIISAALKMALISFSMSTAMMFWALILGCLSTLGFSALQSFVVRLGTPEERGELIGLFTVLAGFYPLFSTLVYNNIYNATLTFFTGFVFSFSASLLLLAAVAVAWIHFDLRKRLRSELLVESDVLETDNTPPELIT